MYQPITPHDPGKYDDVCTYACENTDAQLALTIILGGNQGSGFSVQALDKGLLPHIPNILRTVADGIEAQQEER